MIFNSKNFFICALFLITECAHAGKFQDLLDWATGNTPDSMCKDFAIMYITKSREITPEDTKKLEQILRTCLARKEAVVDHHEKNIAEFDNKIVQFYAQLTESKKS